MLLAIDVGNTNMTIGVWDGANWREHWRLQTDAQRTADEYGILLKMLLREAGVAGGVEAVILVSVVPALTTTLTAVSQRYLNLEPQIVTYQTDTGIQVCTENPAQVGADRIVNVAAAYHLFPGPSIIIDMGTATTFDVVSARGELLGVVIATGLRLAAEALINHAAQLSWVPLEAPPQVMGRNTIHAVQSGFIFGYVSLVEGLVQRLRAEHPDAPASIQIIATGGLIPLITAHTSVIDHVDPWLTLTGLRVIYDRTQSSSSAS